MSDVSAGEVTYHGKVRYRTGASPTDVSAGTEAAGTFVLTYKIHSN
jgi:hypothetical protein